MLVNILLSQRVFGRGTCVLSPHSYPAPSAVLGAAYVLDGIHNSVGYPVPPRGGIVCGTNSTGELTKGLTLEGNVALFLRVKWE